MKLFYVVFLLFVIVGCESLDEVEEVIENNYTTNIFITNINNVITNISSGIDLDNITNVRDDSTLELDGAYDLTTTEIGSTHYLFAAGFEDDGVSVFSISSDGSLDNITNVRDDSTLLLDGAAGLTTVEIGDSNYLFVSGQEDNGVSVFSIGSVGSLDNITNVSDDSTLLLDGAGALTTLEIGSTNYLFVAGASDDGISVFSVGSDGSLDNITNVSDDSTLQFDSASTLTTVEIGSTHYLFIAGNEDDGVSVFSIGSDGSLDNVFNVEDNSTLQLDGTRCLTTVEIGSTNYLFVSGQEDDGISVFSIGSDGSLDNVFNVENNSTLLLDGATHITTVEIGSTHYLFVTGLSDDGFSVFSIGSDGSLDNVFNVEDTDDILPLGGASALTTLEIGSTHYLFVGGFFDNGFSVFSIK